VGGVRSRLRRSPREPKVTHRRKPSRRGSRRPPGVSPSIRLARELFQTSVPGRPSVATRFLRFGRSSKNYTSMRRAGSGPGVRSCARGPTYGFRGGSDGVEGYIESWRGGTRGVAVAPLHSVRRESPAAPVAPPPPSRRCRGGFAPCTSCTRITAPRGHTGLYKCIGPTKRKLRPPATFRRFAGTADRQPSTIGRAGARPISSVASRRSGASLGPRRGIR